MTRKTPKVWIPHQLVSRPGLNPRVGALVGLLRMYAGRKAEAHPSAEQLRQDLGLSTRRQCNNLIAEARRLGLIRVEQREKSVYQLTEHPWLREARLSSEQVSGREYPVISEPWKHRLFRHSVPVPLALLRRSELCTRAAILYGVLDTYARPHAFAKRGTYADRMGLSPQRISDLTGELKRAGLISVRLHRGQHRASNIMLVEEHAWLRELPPERTAAVPPSPVTGEVEELSRDWRGIDRLQLADAVWPIVSDLRKHTGCSDPWTEALARGLRESLRVLLRAGTVEEVTADDVRSWRFACESATPDPTTTPQELVAWYAHFSSGLQAAMAELEAEKLERAAAAAMSAPLH